MTVNHSEPGRRPRRPMFQSLGLAIELWLQSDGLLDPDEAAEYEPSGDLTRV